MNKEWLNSSTGHLFLALLGYSYAMMNFSQPGIGFKLIGVAGLAAGLMPLIKACVREWRTG